MCATAAPLSRCLPARVGLGRCTSGCRSGSKDGGHGSRPLWQHDAGSVAGDDADSWLLKLRASGLLEQTSSPIQSAWPRAKPSASMSKWRCRHASSRWNTAETPRELLTPQADTLPLRGFPAEGAALIAASDPG